MEQQLSLQQALIFKFKFQQKLNKAFIGSDKIWELLSRWLKPRREYLFIDFNMSALYYDVKVVQELKSYHTSTPTTLAKSQVPFLNKYHKISSTKEALAYALQAFPRKMNLHNQINSISISYCSDTPENTSLLENLARNFPIKSALYRNYGPNKFPNFLYNIRVDYNRPEDMSDLPARMESTFSLKHLTSYINLTNVCLQSYLTKSGKKSVVESEMIPTDIQQSPIIVNYLFNVSLMYDKLNYVFYAVFTPLTISAAKEIKRLLTYPEVKKSNPHYWNIIPYDTGNIKYKC